jgi:malonyl-ACP O-methyltransferase BioC
MVEIKKQIRTNFSKKAKAYNKSAIAQRLAAGKLVSLLTEKEHENVLDIGCGTGFVIEELREQRIKIQNVFGLDPAKGMISYCKEVWPENEFICQDAESFEPIKKFDLIISSFAFQWVQDISAQINRYLKFLKPNGKIVLAFPIKGTLSEIYKASKYKNKKPINLLDFPDPIEIAQKMKGKVLLRFIEPIITFYKKPKEAIKAIKQIGAGFLGPDTYSVSQMKNLLSSYKDLFTQKDGKVSLTYNVEFLIIKNR